LLADALEKLNSSGMDLKALHEFLAACMKDKGVTAREYVRRLFVDDYDGHTYKWEFKEPAGMALLSWGDAGIADIKRVFLENPSYANRSIVFDILSAAAAGKGPTRVALGANSDLWAQIRGGCELSTAVQLSARKALVDLVLSVEAIDEVASLVGAVLQKQQFRDDRASIEII
jgi:hypothetical protein